MAASLASPVLFLFSLFTILFSTILAFEVPILDTDYSRQICSGMWGGPSAYINVSFDSTSQGQLAMVIYEWEGAKYLGKAQVSDMGNELPKIYVCTGTSLSQGYCTREQLGHFILNLPKGKNINETSFWSALVQLPADGSTVHVARTLDRRDKFEGNPSPPAIWYNPSPRRDIRSQVFSRETSNSTSDLIYKEPIHYPVTKTGFYCVAAIPVTVSHVVSTRADTDVPFHPSYTGKVLFQNVFKGQLPATDYPKVNFYFVMFLAYAATGGVWAWFCYRHLHDLLPIQFYLSGLVALLVIEMLAQWVYYRYLNAHGRGTSSTVFLIVVSILDAGRNSMSFFMLLVVSLGLSVMRESLGKTMLKCQALATAHFLFGILYSIGIVELELESTSALILLIFIIPLAFTLSGFLLWMMYSLNATITHLRARKQRYKLRMFERLYYILLSVVAVIAIFFVVSSMSFSGRFAEASKITLPKRGAPVGGYWMAGWPSFTLQPSASSSSYGVQVKIIEDKSYFMSFPPDLILFPSTLMLSDELAQDEEDAEDYDLEAIQNRTRLREEDEEDDAATLVGSRRGHEERLGGEDVVFEIGDEDEDEEDGSKKRKVNNRLSGENHRGTDDERQGLVR